MIKIQRATLADAQEIRLLENKVWSEEVTSKWDIATFIECGIAFVAIENAYLGAVVCICHRNGTVHVVDLVVHQSRRREKIARNLYLTLIDHVLGAPIETYVNAQDPVALRFHENMGFVKIRLLTNAYGLWEKDVPRILMRLN